MVHSVSTFFSEYTCMFELFVSENFIVRYSSSKVFLQGDHILILFTTNKKRLRV